LVNTLIRLPDPTMTKELLDQAHKRPAVADVALIVTTVALIVSIVIAATTVSIGIARADTLHRIAAGDSSRFVR
jgi:hypothetical protein